LMALLNASASVVLCGLMDSEMTGSGTNLGEAEEEKEDKCQLAEQDEEN
jgi:hypothetical protein